MPKQYWTDDQSFGNIPETTEETKMDTNAIEVDATAIEAIEKKLSDLDKKVRAHDAIAAQIGAIQKTTEDVERRIAMFEPHAVEAMLDGYADDARDLHKRLKAMIVRMTVATEVLYVLKQEDQNQRGKAAVALIGFFDNPDDWWLKREHLTLGQWAEAVAKGESR